LWVKKPSELEKTRKGPNYTMLMTNRENTYLCVSLCGVIVAVEGTLTLEKHFGKIGRGRPTKRRVRPRKEKTSSNRYNTTEKEERPYWLAEGGLKKE